MDKQKQIEEMAKETCWQQIYPCGDDRPFCFLTHEVCKCCKDNQCDHYEVCERIYNAGYRKIPENAVVLTKEEYEKITYENEVYLMEARKVCQMEVETRHELEKLKRDFDYNLVQERKQIRKETAEKFAKRLKEEAWAFSTDENGNIWDYNIMKSSIDEIAKEIIGEEK